MPTDLRVVTIKLPKTDLYRIPTKNRSEFIRQAVAEKLARTKKKGWRPKTKLEKKLWRLSNAYSGERLDAAEIAEEVRLRRGGLA